MELLLYAIIRKRHLFGGIEGERRKYSEEQGMEV